MFQDWTAGRPSSGRARALLLGLVLAAAPARLPARELCRPAPGPPPFLDPETGERAGPGATVIALAHEEPIRCVLGYGFPWKLSWRSLLSRDWHDGERILPDAVQMGFQGLSGWTRYDLGRRDDTGVTLHGPVTAAFLEFLQAQAPGRWTSTRVPLDLRVRGLVAQAGNGPAGPGHADGRGPVARFRRPCGLLQLPGSDGLVADSEAHVVRAVAADGTVRTLAGAADQPGHVDGPADSARFNGPTFLAARPHPEGGWLLFVADTGNHAIRMVQPDGAVATLAGGEPGFQDAEEASQARFRDPKGVAVGTDGALYVADSGNLRIRRIDLNGRVTTLAGDGRDAGRDGRGGEASFRDLKGLTWQGGRLLVADGHAIRAVTLEGEVRTLCGHPWFPGPPIVGGYTPAVQLLADPYGLDAHGDHVVIAERGNRALTLLSLAEPRRLWRLAGHPDGTRLRYGLLRDGYGGALDRGDATLGELRGVAFADEGRTIRVSTGHGLAQVPEWPNEASGHLQDVLGEPARQTQAAGAEVHWEIAEGLPEGHFRWRVDLVPVDRPDPRPIRVAEGEHPAGGPIAFRLRVDAPGDYHSLVRFIDPGGVTTWIRTILAVTDR